MTDAVLVSMPFGPVMSPSIGLSLIKATLEQSGISSHIRYFSIRFAELVGWTFYSEISQASGPSRENLAGEWIFSHALFDVTSRKQKRYVTEILRRRAAGTSWPVAADRRTLERILRARSRVEHFLEWCLEEVLREEPRVVGFGSTFQQHVASLALARRIKERKPEIAIIFGGANCESAMGAETVRQFPFVDAAVSGEADRIAPELVDRLLNGRPLRGLPGVRTRTEVETSSPSSWTSAPPVENLDSLPLLDYSDYDDQFCSSRFGRVWQPSILFESSRGCWWGQTRRCTFCGLNGTSVAFRSKSAGRVLAELRCLTRKYPDSEIQVTDNILDMQYFDTLIPLLQRQRPKAQLFFETRSNLRKDQLRQMREGGIVRIQPGIESLSTPVLRLMHKGVTALQNVQLLKWCKELNVEVYWNFIWGFPGEPEEEYDRMADVVPLIAHLPPPARASAMRLDRFSPSFERPSAFGFTDVHPIDAYSYIYSLPEAALANLAYYFSYGHADGRSPQIYARRLSQRVLWWQSVRDAELLSVDLGTALLIFDLRPGARRLLTVLSGVPRRAYLAADAIVDVRTLAEECGEAQSVIERRLAPMTSRGLMLREGQRYLALAVPVGDYQPTSRSRVHLRRALRRIGKRLPAGTRIDLREPIARLQRRQPTGTSRKPTRIDASLFSIPDERTLVVRDFR